jgi:DNA topoisomerase-1
LQQEANRKLGFTARRTMQAAQSLYENGHITYMRTDSTNLAQVAVDAARDLIRSLYGAEYLPATARAHANKVKNAQEAHEAIRPAGHPFALPESLRAELSADEFKLYDLIWKRTIASQMSDARVRRLAIGIEGGGATFRVGGKAIDFAGYLRAYVEGSDDPEAELADQETVLPSVVVGEKLACLDMQPKGHSTQPPARYTEATLTKELEGKGIGRPSTYAAIIDTILAREYVFKRGNALVPTWTAFAVVQLLEMHLPELVNYEFTAQMEDELDSISRGEAKWVDYLKSFYFGNGHAGLKQQLANKVDEIDARDVSQVLIGRPSGNGDAGEPIYVRVGRYGPFLQQGERRASIPDGTPPDELTIDAALGMLEQSTQAEEPLGICPETHKPVYLKVGRFGPYVQRGSADDEEKPKNASLLKGMQPGDVDLATALKLLSLPRDLGPHPEGASPLAGKPVVAYNGRFGPYVKCGDETRSLPPEVSPLDVSLAQAVELLAQPKQMRRGFGAARTPVKTFAESPVTKQPIQLWQGRYGPYVSDGTTNASVPKGTSIEELSFEQAVTLLAERAAMGPSKKASRRGRGGPRSAPVKKAAKKAPAKKAPTKKKATKKKKGAE